MYSHLRIVLDPLPPWIYLNKSKGEQHCTGIQCQLLKYISKSLNFSYEFIIDKQGMGYELKNKSWNGFMGQIARNV